MENRSLLYCLLLFGMIQIVLSNLPVEELSVYGEEPQQTIVTSECTQISNSPAGFSYEGDLPPQFPSSLLFDIKKQRDKAKLKSLAKFLKHKVPQLEKVETKFVVRSYHLHHFYLSHNPSQSQLQTFII